MTEIYDFLEKAFNYYNKTLFDSSLPSVVFTLCRNKGVKGYFLSDSFVSKDGKIVNEICINPLYFSKQITEKTLMTLVHEMCHLHQNVLGHKTIPCYHDKAFSNDMKRVGLLTTDTGDENGKGVGFKITQIKIKGGLFEKVTYDFIKENFCIPLRDNLIFEYGEKKVDDFFTGDGLSFFKVQKVCEKEIRHKGGKRVKYTCGCSNVWGKKGLKLICGLCNKEFIEAK